MNKEIKRRKLAPEYRFLLGITAMMASLGIVVLMVYSTVVQRAFFYSGLVISGGLMSYGIYLVKTLSAYKERYFTPRVFSKPVSPDGSKLEDNSELLQEQIEQEISKDAPGELKIKTLFAAAIFIGLTIAGFLDHNAIFYFVWVFSLFFLLMYLKQVSWKMSWLADKIAVYISIILLCFFPPVLYLLIMENADFVNYMYSITLQIVTPALLIFNRGDSSQTGQKQAEKSISEAKNVEQQYPKT